MAAPILKKPVAQFTKQNNANKSNVDVLTNESLQASLEKYRSKRRELTDAEHAEMLSDLERIRLRLKKSKINKPEQQEIISIVRKYLEPSSYNSTFLLDKFLNLLKTNNVGWVEGWIDKNELVYDRLWHVFDDTYISIFKNLVSKSESEKTNGALNPEPDSFLSLLAKQEAMGFWGMMKGLSLGLAGMAGPNFVQKLSNNFDECGVLFFGEDWKSSEPLFWGMNAGQIGQVGGNIIWQIVEFARMRHPDKYASSGFSKLITSLQQLKTAQRIISTSIGVETVYMAGNQIGKIIDGERIRKKELGKELKVQDLLENTDFIAAVETLFSGAVNIYLAYRPAGANEGVTRARIQLLLSTESVLPMLGELIKISQKEPGIEKEKLYGQVLTNLIPQLVSIAFAGENFRHELGRAEKGSGFKPSPLEGEILSPEAAPPSKQLGSGKAKPLGEKIIDGVVTGRRTVLPPNDQKPGNSNNASLDSWVATPRSKGLPQINRTAANDRPPAATKFVTGPSAPTDVKLQAPSLSEGNVGPPVAQGGLMASRGGIETIEPHKLGKVNVAPLPMEEVRTLPEGDPRPKKTAAAAENPFGSTGKTKGTTRVSDSTIVRGLRSIEKAKKHYEAILDLHKDKFEVAIWQDRKTGRFAVVLGNEVEVGRPQGTDDWRSIRHFHPNENNVKRFRLPAGADFNTLYEEYMKNRNMPVHETVDTTIPGGGRCETEFGIDRTVDKANPYYITVRMPGEVPPKTMRFNSPDAIEVFKASLGKMMVDPDSATYHQMVGNIEGDSSGKSMAGSGTKTKSISSPKGLPLQPSVPPPISQELAANIKNRGIKLENSNEDLQRLLIGNEQEYVQYDPQWNKEAGHRVPLGSRFKPEPNKVYRFGPREYHYDNKGRLFKVTTTKLTPGIRDEVMYAKFVRLENNDYGHLLGNQFGTIDGQIGEYGGISQASHINRPDGSRDPLWYRAENEAYMKARKLQTDGVPFTVIAEVHYLDSGAVETHISVIGGSEPYNSGWISSQ